jgi:hypothetical protein
MNECYVEKRTHSRRSTDRSKRWQLIVTMGTLFIMWSALVYIHWLVSTPQ